MKLQTIKYKDLNEDIKDMLLGVTCYNSYLYGDRYVPSNIPFNTLLYMKTEKQLLAVKILMATYVTKVDDNPLFDDCKDGDGRYCSWCFLVQTPYGLEWRKDLRKYIFFYSKEEYFKHVESGVGGLEIKFELLGRIVPQIPVTGSVTFKECWEWNGHCAEQKTTSYRNLIINEDGFSVVLTRYKNQYWTKTDCVKANLEGLDIVEFPQTEKSIKVSIEVVNTPPIVHTLSFIEG